MRKWRLSAIVLLAVAAIVALLTFLDYGITWDEEHSSANGRYFLQWYSSGFEDRSVVNDNNQRLYGSFFNGISRFIGERSPLGLYETGHLLIAMTAWIGLLYTYRLGSLLIGAKAGFFSAVALLLTPAWYGHSFNNPKDTPFAVLFLAAIYYLLRAYHSFPRWSRSELAKAGAAIGLALGIRVGAVFLFGYFFVLFGFWALARHRLDPKYASRRLWKDSLAAGLSFVPLLAIAWIVMLIWWPYAQISPIANPIEAIRANAKFSDWPFTVLYAGNFIRSFEPPWHYLPTWFAITLPEFYGIALGGALGALIFEALAGVTGQKKGRKKTKLKAKPTVNADLELQSKTGFLWFAILFPILTAIGMGSILYDGNRHFLFVIPPLAVLAGCALAWLWDRAGVAPYQAKVAVSALAGISALLTVHDMIALHPYQSTYFNRVFGGLKAAAGRYETDYWGASHQEGIRWLAENYLLGRPDASIRVANTSHPAQTEYLIRGWGEKTRRFLPVSPGDSPNVVLSTTRWNRHEKYAGKILHTVVRDGVPLLYVIEVNGG